MTAAPVYELPDRSAGSRRDGPSVAQRLVALARDRYTFGRSASGDVYAVPKGGPRIARLIRGGPTSLRAELAAFYYRHTGQVAPSGALADAMCTIEGLGQAEEPVELHLRTASDGDDIVIDLGRTDGALVRVTAAGWRVERATETGPLFRRSRLTAALPIPTEGSDLEELRDLLNVVDDSWPLLTSWLIAALMPGIAHPILFLTGEQGTAKTTATKLLVQLIDPSPAPARQAPRDADDWAVAASGSWVVGLDNLSHLPRWLSDAMCRAVTGDGLVKRTLYSDADVTVLNYRRVLVVNGIDVGAIRGDLADRMIPIELQPIAPVSRRTDRDLWAAYEEAHPRLLGALLTLTSKVLAALPAARAAMGTRPRLADYAEILAALDAVTGTSVLDTYATARSDLAEAVIESDPVGTAVTELLERHPTGWEGTVGELAGALVPPRPPPEHWPRTPAAMSGRLTRIAPALAVLGITIDRRRSNGKKLIRLARLRPPATPPDR